MSKLRVYKSNNSPDVHVGNYYVQEGDYLYFEIKPPFINTTNTPLEGYSVNHYNIHLGEHKYNIPNSSLINAKINAPPAGVYPITITANFDNNTSKTYNISENITVFKEWPKYNTNTRILNEDLEIIKLPYSLDDIRIKPNEFGIADVYNSSILKLNHCLNYIKSSLTVMSSKTPTKFIGWLGTHADYPAYGAQWYTCSNTPNLSRDYNNITTNALNTFSNIIDFKIIADNEIFILHKEKNTFNILFSSLQRKFNYVIIQDNSSFTTEAKDVQSFDVEILNTTTRALYLADSLGNRIYKLIIQIEADSISCYLDQFVGGFGSREVPLRFYSPSQILYYNKNVFILDVNNLCIKQLSTSLGWIHTFFIEEFNINTPQYIQISNNILYILTLNNKIYQIDIITKNVISVISLDTTDIPTKFCLDNFNTFYYVIYPSSVKKFNINGVFINNVDINFYNIAFNNIKIDVFNNIYLGDTKRLLKFIDVSSTVTTYEEVFARYMWSEEDMCIKEEEFSQDWIFNRSLKRLTNNVDLTRKSIHSQFNAVSLYVANDIIKYYSTSPVTSTETPECINLTEISGVGANELVLSQVLNNNLEKIYNCINSLVQFVKIKYSTDNNCESNFCWSWKNTSCSTVKLPSLRLCGVNPISFAELTNTFESTYVKTKKWIDAYGECCDGLPPTPSFTPRCTPSITSTNQSTPTLTPTNTQTPTVSPSITLSPTQTPTYTQTPTVSPTNTQTPTLTLSVSVTPSKTTPSTLPPVPPNPPPPPPVPTPTASKCSLIVPIVVISHISPNRAGTQVFKNHTVVIYNQNHIPSGGKLSTAWPLTTLDVSSDKGVIDSASYTRTAYMLVGHPTWTPDDAFWNAIFGKCGSTTVTTSINRKVVIRQSSSGVFPTALDFITDNTRDGKDPDNLGMLISNSDSTDSTKFNVNIYEIIVKADGTLSVADPTFTGAQGTTDKTVNPCGYPCLPHFGTSERTVDCMHSTATDVGSNVSRLGTPTFYTSWPNVCCKAT